MYCTEKSAVMILKFEQHFRDFLTCHFKKRTKSCFWTLKKALKRILAICLSFRQPHPHQSPSLSQSHLFFQIASVHNHHFFLTYLTIYDQAYSRSFPTRRQTVRYPQRTSQTYDLALIGTYIQFGFCYYFVFVFKATYCLLVSLWRACAIVVSCGMCVDDQLSIDAIKRAIEDLNNRIVGHLAGQCETSRPTHLLADRTDNIFLE